MKRVYGEPEQQRHEYIINHIAVEIQLERLFKIQVALEVALEDEGCL